VVRHLESGVKSRVPFKRKNMKLGDKITVGYRLDRRSCYRQDKLGKHKYWKRTY
jgi:hypothetical protein